MRLRRLLTRASIAAAMLLIAGWLFAPTLHWSGGMPSEVQLHVVDAITSAPIANALIQLDGRDVGSTDSNGDARWIEGFGAGGERSIFGRAGHWYIEGRIRITDAAGQSTEVDLQSLVDNPRRSIADRGPVSATVRMKR